jgi:hypothetical protein
MTDSSCRPGLQSLRVAVVVLLTLLATASRAVDVAGEQVLYLPIYSHIYFGDLGKDGTPNNKLLSSHVSIRNTDTRGRIHVTYARYYDTDGKLVKNFLAAPATVPPLGTIEFFVPRSDTSGGSGANFLIGWKADGAVNPPLVEAVHADIEMSRTLIFTTEARPIQVR